MRVRVGAPHRATRGTSRPRSSRLGRGRAPAATTGLGWDLRNDFKWASNHGQVGGHVVDEELHFATKQLLLRLPAIMGSLVQAVSQKKSSWFQDAHDLTEVVERESLNIAFVQKDACKLRMVNRRK